MDATRATKLETHLGCSVRLLRLLAGVDRQFLSDDILKKGRDRTSDSTPSCSSSRGVVSRWVSGSYVHRGVSVVIPASMDLRSRVLMNEFDAPNAGSMLYK